MSYVNISDEQIKQAKELHIADYFRVFEPNELRQISKGEYCLKSHDSFRISKDRWYWNSRGLHGKNAIDYLMSCHNMDFKQSVLFLTENSEVINLPENKTTVPFAQKDIFVLPTPYKNNGKIYAYLRNRGIAKEVINHCIKTNTLYESGDYHSAVFLGRDRENTVKYGYVRGTIGDYKKDIAGSDKRYNFAIDGHPHMSEIRAFESAIDLLSDVTLDMINGVNPLSCHRVALGGTSPLALYEKLDQYPNINAARLCLDGDIAGAEGARRIIEGMKQRFGERYEVDYNPPIGTKDYNGFLQKRIVY